ncbi:hypothetical protein N7449_008520 [Penicillium cf. viridicatum]|uniref:Uncharacterized protein n=1 Tax=Penicillium cf. viridicatum TaxID=2972119 RepID=A0A9W9J960_9EURO|nr:hypothetical protein N7449_008520 [Penicillium cf. viridicatum]
MNGPLLLRCLGDADVLRNAAMLISDDPQRYLRYYRNLCKSSIRPSNEDYVTTAPLLYLGGKGIIALRRHARGPDFTARKPWTTNKGEGSHQTFP